MYLLFNYLSVFCSFLSASLYFSKRGAYWDRLCRDVVGRWSLVVTRVHCGQTVHPMAYSYYRTLIGTPTPGIQWYKFRPLGVTPNRGMPPPWGAFCQITLTSCYYYPAAPATVLRRIDQIFYLPKALKKNKAFHKLWASNAQSSSYRRSWTMDRVVFVYTWSRRKLKISVYSKVNWDSDVTVLKGYTRSIVAKHAEEQWRKHNTA